MTDSLKQHALRYHSHPRPGKISVIPTKATATQLDLSLCYTPGVAEPVLEIAKDPRLAYSYTSKANLVAVITNGTAVLGLGNVGALASKPVMEGKGVLFKRFADIDVFDIEVDCENPEEFINTVVNISPTFGGINLEDIKAPECFYIEQQLRSKLQIPVFHDDQHGTAIVIAAGLLNALELQNKNLENVRIVCAGAGSAGIAAMHLLTKLGAKLTNIFMIDRIGVIHNAREDLNSYKAAFAHKTDCRTLNDALTNADVFIGVSGPGLLSAESIKLMAPNPVIFALSNPIPEIMPETVFAMRSDAIMATGRSDFPNQVNNALCFPYIFRGALDARATCINETMQLAAVYALKDLTKEAVPAEIMAAYPLEKSFEFGPDYLLPKLIDPRLRERVSSAVLKAAIESGAAQ